MVARRYEVARYILAGLPLEPGYSVRLANWTPGEDGPDLVDSPPFAVTGKESVQSSEGASYDCWVVEAKGSRISLRSYLAKKPPYLIKQVMIQPDGTEQVGLELVRKNR